MDPAAIVTAAILLCLSALVLRARWREQRERRTRLDALLRGFREDVAVEAERAERRAPALVLDLRRYREVRAREEKGGAA